MSGKRLEKKRSKWEGAEMGTIGDKRDGKEARDKRHWVTGKGARGAGQGTRDKRQGTRGKAQEARGKGQGEGERDWARGQGQEIAAKGKGREARGKRQEFNLAREGKSPKATQLEHFTHVGGEEVRQTPFLVVDLIGTDRLCEESVVAIDAELLQNKSRLNQKIVRRKDTCACLASIFMSTKYVVFHIDTREMFFNGFDRFSIS